MFSKQVKYIHRISVLMIVHTAFWMTTPTIIYANENPSPTKVNLALHRTADGLLRLSGDSTSRIPAVKQTGEKRWQIQLEQTFNYDELPALLKTSLDIHNITQAYDVTVRRCDNDTIDLGYNYLDILGKNSVACMGREMPQGCHYIEVNFLDKKKNNQFYANKWLGIFIIISIAVGYWLYRRQKKPSGYIPSDKIDWIKFGNSRLDVTNQVLICNGIRETLTFREAKLLQLFAKHNGQLLERDVIIQRVWADEGILVGRSVDVFVSRLRKKLINDTSVSLSVVHGVGYRMESLQSA
ncbi:MAG: response regulator transcription factor [Saprospiraceae bacterium]|nr:response regulator transcription factor [Saprospiraceae bacterium]